MRFNEKELAYWASSFVPDREGMMDKKGANYGQGNRMCIFVSVSLSSFCYLINVLHCTQVISRGGFD